jgi:hypothetical protein
MAAPKKEHNIQSISTQHPRFPGRMGANPFLSSPLAIRLVNPSIQKRLRLSSRLKIKAINTHSPIVPSIQRWLRLSFNGIAIIVRHRIIPINGPRAFFIVRPIVRWVVIVDGPFAFAEWVIVASQDGVTFTIEGERAFRLLYGPLSVRSIRVAGQILLGTTGAFWSHGRTLASDDDAVAFFDRHGAAEVAVFVGREMGINRALLLVIIVDVVIYLWCVGFEGCIAFEVSASVYAAWVRGTIWKGACGCFKDCWQFGSCDGGRGSLSVGSVRVAGGIFLRATSAFFPHWSRGDSREDRSKADDREGTEVHGAG